MVYNICMSDAKMVIMTMDTTNEFLLLLKLDYLPLTSSIFHVNTILRIFQYQNFQFLVGKLVTHSTK